MQFDPIKPTLKPPGTKRLKLKYDESLFDFAFEFNLRRYIKDLQDLFGRARPAGRGAAGAVGRCRLTLSNPC